MMEQGLQLVDGRLARLLLLTSMGLFAAGVVFAAVAIGLHLLRERQLRRRSDVEARWTGPLLSVLAGAAPPAVLLSEVREDEYGHLAAFLLAYASRLRGPERRAIQELAVTTMPAVMARLRRGSPGARAESVRTLAVLGAGSHLPLLVAALNDPSMLVRATAVQALCQPRYAVNPETILAALAEFSRWSPRLQGILLARMGPVAAPALRALLGDNAAKPPLRVAAAFALRALNDGAAAPIAAVVVRRETNAEVIAACLRLFERVGTANEAPVVRALLDSPDAAIRGSAVRALSHVGDAGDLPGLALAMNDSSPLVAVRAAYGLARLDYEALGAMARTAGGRPAQVAIEALARR